MATTPLSKPGASLFGLPLLPKLERLEDIFPVSSVKKEITPFVCGWCNEIERQKVDKALCSALDFVFAEKQLACIQLIMGYLEEYAPLPKLLLERRLDDPQKLREYVRYVGKETLTRHWICEWTGELGKEVIGAHVESPLVLDYLEKSDQYGPEKFAQLAKCEPPRYKLRYYLEQQVREGLSYFYHVTTEESADKCAELVAGYVRTKDVLNLESGFRRVNRRPDYSSLLQRNTPVHLRHDIDLLMQQNLDEVIPEEMLGEIYQKHGPDLKVTQFFSLFYEASHLQTNALVTIGLYHDFHLKPSISHVSPPDGSRTKFISGISEKALRAFGEEYRLQDRWIAFPRDLFLRDATAAWMRQRTPAEHRVPRYSTLIHFTLVQLQSTKNVSLADWTLVEEEVGGKPLALGRVHKESPDGPTFLCTGIGPTSQSLMQNEQRVPLKDFGVAYIRDMTHVAR